MEQSFWNLSVGGGCALARDTLGGRGKVGRGDDTQGWIEDEG